MKLTAAPAIQGPSSSTLAELARRIDSDSIEGPCFVWDQAAEVFITAVVHQGVIVNWQIDPARTRAEADALKDRLLQHATMAAMALAQTMPGAMRDELQEHLARGLGRYAAH